MTPRRVQIIGGGPGGSYAARLLKIRHPRWEIRLCERLVPDETFGFGVGLTQRTLGHLRAADRTTHDRIVTAGHPTPVTRLYTFGGHSDIPVTVGVAIARSTLLRTLLQAAEEAGVRVDLGTTLTAAEADADLIIAAEGVNSATRAEMAAPLGASVTVGGGLYLWCGGDRAFETNFFAPVRTEHGVFTAHAYPYARDRSTVLIETDEATWKNAGFGRAGRRTPPGASDEVSIRYLQEAFASFLGGGTLIGNRSRWLRFHTVRCERWHHGNVVLLGDAAHTAHYSLGSGTKLALEDAIGLCEAVSEDETVERWLDRYESRRRRPVSRLQELARRSQLWWESFGLRAGLPPAQVAVSYLSRAGVVSLARLSHRLPQLQRAGRAAYAGTVEDAIPEGDPRAWVLSRPLRHPRLSAASRVVGRSLLGVTAGVTDDGIAYAELAEPTARRVAEARRTRGAATLVARLDVDPRACGGRPEAELLDTCRTLLSAGCDGIRLAGGPDRPALLDRLALAERIRLSTGALVVVEGPERHADDLVDGLVAARTDMVAVAG